MNAGKGDSMRTMEQRLVFDSGLCVNSISLVRFTMNGRARDALVEIKRKRAYVLMKPEDGDMYSCWYKVKDNGFAGMRGNVIVWGARDPELMHAFDGEPLATLEVYKA